MATHTYIYIQSPITAHTSLGLREDIPNSENPLGDEKTAGKVTPMNLVMDLRDQKGSPIKRHRVDVPHVNFRWMFHGNFMGLKSTNNDF
jgi:hypothetical protein